MNLRRTLPLMFLSLSLCLAARSADAHGPHSYDQLTPSDFSTHSLDSDSPPITREFRVKLPLSYRHKPHERYPVLFVLDANRPFVSQETISIVNTLVDRHKIPELILVFLPPGSDEARVRDYTPSQQADQFLDFIEAQLIPFMDESFRTEPLRLVNGHSRSGLLVMYSLLKRPHLFGAHIALSPAFWHDDDLAISHAKSTFQSLSSLDNSLYLNIGGEENEKIFNSFERMRFVLNRYAPSNLEWRADVAEYESHGSTRVIGMYVSLRRFFTDWDKPWNDVHSLEQLDEMGGADVILERYEKLSETYGYRVRPQGLDAIGKFYLETGKTREAVRVLEIDSEFSPQSPHAFLELSKAYLANGNRESALAAIETASERARQVDDQDLLKVIHSFKERLKK